MITYAILFFSFTIPPPAHGKRENKCQYLRTKDEFDCFIQTFEKDDPYYTAFLILYFCVLRIGSKSMNPIYTILYQMQGCSCFHILPMPGPWKPIPRPPALNGSGCMT